MLQSDRDTGRREDGVIHADHDTLQSPMPINILVKRTTFNILVGDKFLYIGSMLCEQQMVVKWA